MEKTKVAVVKSREKPSEKQIDTTVRKAVELAGGFTDVIRRGDTVIIKPNLVVAKPPEAGATTDPRVCKTICDIVRDLGGNPIIAESSFVGLDTEEAIQTTGYRKLRKEGYEVIDLKKKGIETVKVSIPRGKALKEVHLPKIVVEANAIISVPKMKTHDQAEVTLALKNMKGVLPDAYKRKFHHIFGVFQSVADLMTVMKPAFSIVDGIIAMNGLGPAFGDPIELDLIIAGKDAVAVDAVTAKIMGFEPQECGCVREAAESKIGIIDLDKIGVVGEPITKVQRRFQRAEEAVMEKVSFPKGFRVIISEKACTGCRNQILSSLFDLKEAGLLDKAAGWTVVSGKNLKLPSAPREKLLLVGACVSPFKKEANFVEGCPPNSRDIISGLGIAKTVGMVDIDALEAEGV